MMTWPAEWSDHDESVMIWPGRRAVWDPYMEEARQEFRAAAVSISDFETVRIVVGPGSSHSMSTPATVYPIITTELPTDDSWARDTGPLFMTDEDTTVAVAFGFNSWGNKYQPFDNDAAFASRLAEALNVPLRTCSLILEGGAIDVDGFGTAILVETSVIAENRNPGVSKAEVEQQLHDHLDVSHVIWLPYGLLDDNDTDGHVDNVARFVSPGRVLCQTVGRDRDENERLARNRHILAKARDARGYQLEIVDLPWLPYSSVSSARPASYCNFYVVNGAVLVPVTGSSTDEAALALIGRVTDRDPVSVQANFLAYGGGGIHCIVMPRFSTREEGR